jgi:hypothetical protein
VHAALFVAEQAPQVPFGWQAAVAPEHSPSATQPRHTWVVPSHTGLVDWHCVPARHATQTPVVVSHVGFVVAHAVAFVAEHAPHAPDGSHAGVAPPQSASAAQARHVLVPGSHTGLLPPHCAAVVQTVQVPDAASQVVTAPVHEVVFVGEQTPQRPEGWHAGAAPPHSPSAAHPRHTCVVASQVGFAPPH